MIESDSWTGKIPFWYLFKPINYVKERLASPIRAGGGCERLEELYEIPYKGVEQKKEERIKDWKKGGKLGQVVGALKREGLEPPFELW